MEATLQRNKPKSHRSKSKHSSDSKSLEVEGKQKILNHATKKNEENLLQKKIQDKDGVHIVPENMPPVSSEKNPPAENDYAKNSENNTAAQIMQPLFNTSEQNEPSSEVPDSTCINSAKAVEVSVKPAIYLYAQCSEKLSEVQYSAVDIVESEACVLKSQQTFDIKEQTKLQQVYPDLKYCEQLNNIECSQTLVKTYTDDYQMKTVIEANKAYEEFIKVTHQLHKEPLQEIIHQYFRAKKSCIQLRSRMKYLKSDVKRKKDSLWKSVKKEVSAKGKCDDGFCVKITHSFLIKELDQNKFNEVIKNLKEIEESMSSDAFNSYLEELTRLRIEHFLHGLVKDGKSESIEPHVDDEYSEEDNISLKKCISVLFECQRQNVQDKSYIETCQEWLKTLVSKLLKYGKFQDNILIMNHVLRCPKGIQSWASQFIQVPFNECENDQHAKFACICSQQILLALYLLLNPVPLKEFFLKSIKESSSTDSVDGNFAILDSEGEEEETYEISKNWSDADIVSLLNQIPVRSLYKHILLANTSNTDESPVRVQSEESMLKMFAYSTAVVNVLFKGLETYGTESYPRFFEAVCNLVRHILSYISDYWIHQENICSKPQIQAVYDRFIFHIIFKICTFERLNSWRILSTLPYQHISKKMLWNILWIFFCPGRSEEEIYTEKDVERKIKDESAQCLFVSYIEGFSPRSILYLLNALETISKSSSDEEDFLTFLLHLLFKITFIEPSLKENLMKEGIVIVSSVLILYPHLVSELLKKIDECDEEVISCSINLFKGMNILNWTPEDSDINILSSWLLLNTLPDAKNRLARVIFKNLNWEFNKEGSLFLPYPLHRRIAILVSEAYLNFVPCVNEQLVSWGVKQMLQFASVGGYQRDEDEFVHWAWNLLFCLKLHPLDRKLPNWVHIYDGYIDNCDKPTITGDNFCEPVLLSAYEKRHPSGCYLMIVLANKENNMKHLMETGLNCLSSLVENKQYMAAIKSLYYVLPFFVKNSEQLLERFSFMKVMSDLITADMTVMSNITGEPVIGAVLHTIAAMMKYQIDQAIESTVECATPLLKLWIKILMKIFSLMDNSGANNIKSSAKQIYFLLDILVKMSYIHCYMRDCTLDLLSAYCNPLLLSNTTQTSSKPFWRRMFSSNSSMNAILKRNIIPEYPWLAWFILSSEMKQKNIQDLWSKMQAEMVKQNDAFPGSCLKKVSDDLKIEQPPIESLPIYRWALQAIKVPLSNPVAPLLWQQFFFYFFHRIHLPNSQHYLSIGMKYFKNGPHIALLKQIKEHLADGVKSYKNSFKIPDSHCMPVVDNDKLSKCDAELAFHLNILKIFQAFHLWIDDESLHESNLCLSTLEPKYCPDRLKLVLTGDQNIWYDLISNTCLKEEVDQKVHSWLDKKTPDTIHEQPPVNVESLPQHLSRHIGSYEAIEAVSNDIPISTVVPEITSSALSSSDILMCLIEKNQCIIFDKAKYFSEQMKKLKQLNFNFNNWVPQEYKIEDSELIERKVCHKGNGSNGCSGAALFKLQIQKCTKNARISDRIYKNRSDYLILQDQLSKLPVKDICIATLHIENFIRSLAKRMRMSEREEKERLRSMGIALFYHQVNAIDKIISSVVEYSPSRQFFCSIIESLGREFIEGADSELLNLTMSILNHPEAGSLALPLFNPNKSCVQDFQSVYEALTLAVGKYSSSTLIALFSKIDFSIWLKESSPNFDSRREIFRNVCNALLSCGFTPPSELLPVFEILKRHFRTILSYVFPELFQDAVVFLLNGIENNNLSVDVFYETFYCFGCPLFNNETSVEDIEKALQKFAQNQQLPANQQIFISVVRMNLKQVQHAANNFYYHFMKKRLCCQLYKSHALYIKPLGIFLAIISHSFVALHFDEISSHSKILSISNLWEEFHLPFKPWIHPSENTSGLSFPWSEEVDKAHFMFKIFASSVKYFHEQVLSHECEESVLSYMWNCYVQIYVVPGHRHYSVSVCHSEMMNLPWHQFHPSAHDIEGMCKVLQSSLYENKEFLSKISLKIPWSDVMKSISLTKSPEYMAKVLVTLGKLLIISQFNCAETDCSLYPSIFKELESLPWHFLSVADTAGLLDLYYTNSDHLLLLDNLQRNSDIHILQFLKLVCCLVPNSNADEYSNDKRILYLQKFVSALSALVASKGAQLLKSINKFKVLLPSLLDEVDNAIRNGVEPGVQVNYALPLVKATLSFLTTLPGGELETAALNSVRSWLNANTQSPLLLSCLKVSSQGLSVSHMVSLSECCISARFSSEILDTKTREVWQLISSFFHVPSSSSEEFIQKCVEKNAYLTLYCYTLHKLPHSASRESKKMLLLRAVQWVRESNLSTCAEAKFLLLWDIILKLSISLVSLEESQVVKQELVSFCWELENLAKDRSDSGFFATIGFGQASSLSVNFRFLCRVMSAFILYQIPDNCPIRLEPMDSHHLFSASDGNKTGGSKSNQEPSFSRSALKAMENLKALLQKKLYTALQSQVDYAITCILDPTYNLSESRKLLKYFSIALYPKESYLSALDS